MPRGGDDLASTDEVKVYKDEGDDENRASQNLLEDKRELVRPIETEEGKDSDFEDRTFLHDDKTTENRNYFGSDNLLSGRLPFGYPPLITPYPYPGSASASFGLGGVSPFYMYNNDLRLAAAASLHLSPHPGIAGSPSSVYNFQSSAAAAAAAVAAGLAGSQSPYGFPSAPASHAAAAAASHLAAAAAAVHHHNPFYPSADMPAWSSSVPPFSSTYSTYHQLSRLGALGSIHPGISYPGVSRPALVAPAPPTRDLSPPRSGAMFTGSESRRHSLISSIHNPSINTRPQPTTLSVSTSATVPANHQNSISRHHMVESATVSASEISHPACRQPVTSAMSPLSLSPSTSSSVATARQHNLSHHPVAGGSSINHIKKPLNAFMLFMKEMRQKVIEECTLKESAAINQILGRKWHSLDRSEQARYYELARREKELHRKRYPLWSARDNYALHSRKRHKRINHRPSFRHDGFGDDETDVSNAAKKCRARYGLEQQNQWCKPCRRKKRCIRFVSEAETDNFIADSVDDEGDNATTLSSVPPAADSTTELFSPMPLSASSSSSSSSDEALPQQISIIVSSSVVTDVKSTVVVSSRVLHHANSSVIRSGVGTSTRLTSSDVSAVSSASQGLISSSTIV